MFGNVSVGDANATVERRVRDGREVIETPLPAVLTVSSEIGEPRYPSVRRIRQAFAVEVPTWSSADIAPGTAMNQMLSLSIPVHDAQCHFMEGESPEEMGKKLAIALREAKVI